MYRIYTVAFFLFLSTQSFAQSTRKFIDTANMDLSVNPADNFYQYANGGWLKKTSIPSTKSSWSTVNIISENTLQALKLLLENSIQNPDSSNKTIADFYYSGMDSITIEKLSYTPIQQDLKRIDSINNMSQVISEIATLRTKGIASPLFGFYITQDAKNSSQYIPQFDQGGITLPDRDYYLKTDTKSVNIRNLYKKYIIDLFELINIDSTTAKKNADDILNVETILAQSQMSKSDMRNPEKTYHKLSAKELNQASSNINWEAILQAMMVKNQDSVLVSNIAFLKTTDSLLNSMPLPLWKTYLKWYIVKGAAPYLSNNFVDKNFKFSKVFTGQQQITPRWQRITSLTDSKLGDLLSQLYVAKYFKPEAKQKMLDLVNNLQKAFEERILRVTWMSDTTKQKAIEKLHSISKKIGYADKWKTYDSLYISRTDFLQNIRNCNQWNYLYDIKRLGSPVDKNEWYFSASTINAGYDGSNNNITFPAGILQPPFFDANADDAVNYGGIGAVIGHEITHGFDDKGKMFDKNGNLNNWWTTTDTKNFSYKAKQVEEQFNQLTVLDTIHVNGKLTLGENIADLGGLNIAYEAFKKTVQGQTNIKIDGFTPDQRFFLSWAQVWKNKTLPEAEAQAIIIDYHAPAKHRATAPLTNIDAFYKAFNVLPNNKMYKPEKERIQIW